MATVKNFEELEVWQLAREFCKDVYAVIESTSLRNNWKLRDQIDASAGSIMDNIAEGFERGGTKEFIQFLGFSTGSCGESRSQLYRIYDRSFISKEKFTELNEKTLSLSKQLNGFIGYLKKTDIKGYKKGYKFQEDQAGYLVSQSQISNT
ncbi:MAG: four helix bundle protein [Flavobacteriales bacterium]|nr:four helix bundle protein [Flavobacteriales bacterium]